MAGQVFNSVVEPTAACRQIIAAYLPKCSLVGRETIGNQNFRPPISAHQFSKHFQWSTFVSSRRDDAFQNLAFVIDGSPKIVAFAVELHENLVDVHCHREKARNCWMRRLRISDANIGPNRFCHNRMVSWPTSMPRSCSRSSTFRSDIGNRTYSITAADDLRARLEVLEWGAFGHGQRLRKPPARLKPLQSDITDQVINDRNRLSSSALRGRLSKRASDLV